MLHRLFRMASRAKGPHTFPAGGELRRPYRHLNCESLESRSLLAADLEFESAPSHNSCFPIDTNDDSVLSPGDALIVVNHLALLAGEKVDEAIIPGNVFPDVDGDGSITTDDATLVLEQLANMVPRVWPTVDASCEDGITRTGREFRVTSPLESFLQENDMTESAILTTARETGRRPFATKSLDTFSIPRNAVQFTNADAFTVSVKDAVRARLGWESGDSITFSDDDFHFSADKTLGVSGFAILVKGRFDPMAPLDWSGTTVTSIVFYVVVREVNQPDVTLSNGMEVRGPATVNEHEEWHTDGIPVEFANVAKRKDLEFNENKPGFHSALVSNAFRAKDAARRFVGNAREDISAQDAKDARDSILAYYLTGDEALANHSKAGTWHVKGSNLHTDYDNSGWTAIPRREADR